MRNGIDRNVRHLTQRYSNETKRFLEQLSEDEFRELVVIPLLEEMDYKEVRSLHGVLERGKDVVFREHTPLDDDFFCCAIVKTGRVTGDVTSSQSLRGILFQAQQAFDTDFLLPDGRRHSVRKVYLFVNSVVSQQALQSIEGVLGQQGRTVTCIDLPRILTLVEKHMPEMFEGASSALAFYLARLFRENYLTKNLQLFGCTREIPLHYCYTGGQVESGQGKALTAMRGSSIQDVLQEGKHVLVCGPPGSGKSTMLQKLVLDMVGQSSVRPKRETSTVPILVELRNLTDSELASKRSFIKFLKGHLGEDICAKQTLTGFRDWVLALDGFDEISNASAREAFEAVLSSLPGSNLLGKPLSACVVTSRSYALASIPGYRTVFPRPFGYEEIDAFALRWFGTDQAALGRFRSFLEGRRDLVHLASTPLLLTMMVALAERGIDELPDSRTDIYETTLDMMVFRWDVGRGIAVPYSQKELTRFLMYLGISMLEEGISAAGDAMLARVGDTLREEGFADPGTSGVDGVLARFRRNGVLTRNKAGLLEFTHATLREFLAARYCYKFRDERRLTRNLPKQSWWSVAKFYFGFLQRLDVAGASLLEQLKRIPFLNLECAIEANRTPGKLKKEIVDSVIHGLTRGDIRFDEEAVPIVHLVGDRILEHLEDILSPKGRIQVAFYVALCDLLSSRNDRASRLALRRLHKLIEENNPTPSQRYSMALSYLLGKNSLSGDLLKILYASSGDVGIAGTLLEQSPARIHGPHKAAFISAIARDHEALVHVDRLNSQESVGRQARVVAELCKCVSQGATNVGICFAASSLRDIPYGLDHTRTLLEACQATEASQHTITALRAIRENLARNERQVRKRASELEPTWSDEELPEPHVISRYELPWLFQDLSEPGSRRSRTIRMTLADARSIQERYEKAGKEVDEVLEQIERALAGGGQTGKRRRGRSRRGR